MPAKKRKAEVTQAELQAMYDKQEGVCAICYIELTLRSYIVDSCPSTHLVRGLLCRRCSSAIDLLNDSADVCRSAAEYLVGHYRLVRKFKAMQ
jgi:hypothetical protein